MSWFNKNGEHIIQSTLFIFSFLFLANAALAAKPTVDKNNNSAGDPFGEYSTIDGAEEEDDLEMFYHTGRFFQLSATLGISLPVGGAVSMILDNPIVAYGARVSYFFDMQIAGEAGALVSGYNMGMPITPIVGTTSTISTINWREDLINSYIGMRYYFDVIDMVRSLSAANPYFNAGGVYSIRTRTLDSTQVNQLREVSNQFDSEIRSAPAVGFYVGGGLEFSFYHDALFLGADIRYLMINYSDEKTALVTNRTIKENQAFDIDYLSFVLVFTKNY